MSCSRCGCSMDVVGSPNSRRSRDGGGSDKSRTASEKEMESRGSYLLTQRFQAQSGFILSSKQMRSFAAKWPGFQSAAVADAKRMMGGDIHAEEFVEACDSLQRRIVKAGIGSVQEVRSSKKTRVGPVRYVVEPPMTIQEYAVEKTRLRSRGDQARQVAYAAALYASRSFTLYVLEESGHIEKSSRLPMYAKGQGRALLDGVSFEMVVASEPDLPRPEGARSAFHVARAEDFSAQESEGDSMADQVVEFEEASDLADDIRSDSRRGMPFLRMFKGGAPVGVNFVTGIGSLLSPNGFTTIPLLTTTSKMSSPSFGLPAGRPGEGGTCSGAGVEGTALTGDGQLICRVCYATGANYAYANNMLQQEARRRWVVQLLGGKASSKLSELASVKASAKVNRSIGAVPSSVKTCGYALAVMVASYARDTSLSKASKGSSGRAGQELGLWSQQVSSIVVPMSLNDRFKRADDTPLRLSTVGKVAVPSSTQAFFEALDPGDGEVVGFFRVHDSGDFSIGPKEAEYIEAWRVAAICLPRVYFWAPTRVWAARKKGDALSAEAYDWLERGTEAALHPGACKTTWKVRGGRAAVARGRRLLRGIFGSASKAVLESTQSPGEGWTESLKHDVECGYVVVPKTRAQLKHLLRLAALPNFTLRPSALYIRESARSPVFIPYVDGLDAGSGVSKGRAPALPPELKAELKGLSKEEKAARTPVEFLTKYPVSPDGRGICAWQCPVYTKEDGVEAKSCQQANCRASWLATDLPVFYGAH